MDVAAKIDLILTGIRMVCQVIIVGLLLIIVRETKAKK